MFILRSAQKRYYWHIQNRPEIEWNDGHFTPSTNAMLVTWQKQCSDVSVLASSVSAPTCGSTLELGINVVQCVRSMCDKLFSLPTI